MWRQEKEAYTVSQINGYMKNIFLKDMLLNQVSIKGEVSNCKYHTSGHIYFTLKDDKGQLSCVMFAGQRGGLAFRLADGQRIIASGSIRIYERDGKYQLYAGHITHQGVGQLYEQFEKQKERLHAEGLFDSAHKKQIPLFPRKVGIVTALTGAALKDIQNIAGRRNPCIQLILCPVQVQGLGAAEEIARGIRRLDRYGVDVIIVARGGGSMEDLWAFNEELVARAAYECGTPIISGVGHETDVTIIDYVADLRAPTPSAAAELAVYERAAFAKELLRRHSALAKRMEDRINEARKELEAAKLRLSYASPRYQLLQKRRQAADMGEALKRRVRDRLLARRHRLELAIERMKGASPLGRLNQGYSYVAGKDGRCVASVCDVKPQDRLVIAVRDGSIIAEVKEVTKKEWNAAEARE